MKLCCIYQYYHNNESDWYLFSGNVSITALNDHWQPLKWTSVYCIIYSVYIHFNYVKWEWTNRAIRKVEIFPSMKTISCKRLLFEHAIKNTIHTFLTAPDEWYECMKNSNVKLIVNSWLFGEKL